jgi:L-lactate dehydrogenase (cytochrome)
VAEVGSYIKVRMDGGICSGQDVRKALEIIHKELDISMAFCGHTDIQTVDKSILLTQSY